MEKIAYQDGIYFDMPDEEYHRIPALSSTGCKNLLISPVDFWARSWMNPKSRDEEGDATDSAAKMIGRAYHKRVIEGEKLFYEQYAAEFDGEDLPDSAKDIADKLKRAGYESSGSKTDLLARAARHNIPTYAAEAAAYYDENEDKKFLSADLIESIEISAAMIEKSPILARCFRGGYPEVTILWTENGIRFKARLDYLKARAIIDLKTFENRQMKSVDKAIYSTMATYKYHIQSVFYLKAVEAAKRLFGKNLLDYAVTEQQIEFAQQFIACPEHDFYFIFQQKGIAPFARLYKFPRTTMWSIGQAQIEAAIQIYKDGHERFGEEQWVDTAEVQTLEDEGFPPWATTDL